MVVAIEADEGRELAQAAVKSLTGGTPSRPAICTRTTSSFTQVQAVVGRQPSAANRRR